MSKEEIYDDRIRPLMVQIIEICKENKIALLANFRLDEDLCATTALLSDSHDPSEQQIKALEVLRPTRAQSAAFMITTTRPQ